MSRGIQGASCPSCRSTNLVSGRLGVNRHTFVPTGRWMLLGYGIKAMVCLDCGFLGHFLEPEDLNDIRRKRT